MKLIKVENYGCNPCKTMDFILQDLGVTPEKVNITENEEFSLLYDVMRVPTLMLFDNDGCEVDRVVGVEDVESIKELVKKFQ